MSEKLLSVGIDIGTSTTQIVLSELYIRNMASDFTIPRILITDKKVIFKSEILFTPISGNNLIDSHKIKEFVQEQYKIAGVLQKDIQTGAIIITGETVRKENARAVAKALSGFAGDFVVATAGPDLESIIAGKGAGTYSYSTKQHTTAVNLDIGGGTTNLVSFYDGDILDTGCFDIGGRLIKVNTQNRVTYIAPKIEKIIADENIHLSVNDVVDLSELDKVLSIMVNVLENSLGIGEKSPYYNLLITNKDMQLNREIEYVSFSGGVADYISKDIGDDLFKYGDIGLVLGKKIYDSKILNDFKQLPSVETIRATVVGAGSHTTEVSGSTITYKENILPVQNIPVLKLSKDDEFESFYEELPDIIKDKLKWYETDEEQQLIALAIEGLNNPSFQYIQEMAGIIIKGLEKIIQKREPVILLVKEDMAKALGHSLYANLPNKYPFICIDNIHVRNGDYIDIGKAIAGGNVLPVVIKTLIFN